MAWLTKIAIDHAIAEPAADIGKVAVVPGAFTWNDVGDFATLSELLPQEGGVATLTPDGDVLAIDASGLIVAGGGRTVAVVGVPDIIVVDTGDTVMVTTKQRAQDVKALVDALKDKGRADLT